MSSSLLYYPSIDIRDGAWLRNALLYWDSVSSIVPNEYEPEFSPEIQFLQKEGLYIPSYPSELFHSENYSDFETEVMKKLRPLRMPSPQTKSTFAHKTKIKWPELSSLIHYRKLPGELCDFMQENHLIIEHDNEWLEMESRTATIYMSTMAEHLAKIHRTPMIVGTDKNILFRNTFRRVLPSERNFCFSVCLQEALPVPDLSIPLTKVVKFKRKRTMELLEFKMKLNKFESQIAACSDCQEIRQAISNFRDEWTLAFRTYDRILKEDKIEYTLGSMRALASTSIPGIAASIGAALGAFPTWAAISSLSFGGAIGIGYNHFQYHKAVREHRSAPGFAYLYDATKYKLLRPSHNTRFF